MKVCLINIDQLKPHLALEKIAMWHRTQGDEVIYDMPLVEVDKTYVSCVFDWNKHLCDEWIGKAEIGGSGYDLTKKLPPEIDTLKPKLNYGFTTRGCIRSCPFCIVPQKEGKVHVVGDIYDLWDGQSKEITLLDNNILAIPEQFKLVCGQLQKHNLKVDFNQGLDCRLLTPEIVNELAQTRHVEYRFAFDHLSIRPYVEKAVKMFKDKIGRAFWYVYCDNDFESALERVLILKRLKQRPYLMRDRKVRGIEKFNWLANWVNRQGALKAMDFYEFMRYYRNRGINKNKGQRGLFE